jgi:hypothetical protein
MLRNPSWSSERASSTDRAIRQDALLLSDADESRREEQYRLQDKSGVLFDEHGGARTTTSSWRIGWQTPTLMVLFYMIGIRSLLYCFLIFLVSLTVVILALVIAVTHAILFWYIDGKLADGPDRVAPQTYISTASNLLGSYFRFFLSLFYTILGDASVSLLHKRSSHHLDRVLFS